MRCGTYAKRDEQYAPSPIIIRQTPQNRVCQKHRKGVGRQQQCHHAGRHAHCIDDGIGQHRNQRTHTNEINSDNQQQNRHVAPIFNSSKFVPALSQALPDVR